MSAGVADDLSRPARGHGLGLADPRFGAGPVDLVARQCCAARSCDGAVAGHQATMAPTVTLLKEEVWSVCGALARGDDALSCAGLLSEAKALLSVLELLEDRLLVT